MEWQRSVMRWRRLRDTGREFLYILFLACTFKSIMGGFESLCFMLWNIINLELRSAGVDRTRFVHLDQGPGEQGTLIVSIRDKK